MNKSFVSNSIILDLLHKFKDMKKIYNEWETKPINNEYSISKTLFQKELLRAKQHKEEVKKFIQPIYDNLQDTKDDKKKRHELIDLGSFVINSKLELSILEATEEPDFIVKHNDIVVGIENQQLIFNKSLKKDEGTLNSFINKAEKTLKNEYNIDSGIFRISFIKDQKQNIYKSPLDFINEIINLVLKKTIETKFIKELRHSPSKQLSIYSETGNKELFEVPLQYIIDWKKDKEIKLPKYRLKGCNEYWLLLTITSTDESGSYHQFCDEFFNKKIPSKFDRIFIQDFYNRIVYELNIQQ